MAVYQISAVFSCHFWRAAPQGRNPLITGRTQVTFKICAAFLAFCANVPQKRLLLSMVALLCERPCEYERNLSSACTLPVCLSVRPSVCLSVYQI